MRMGKLVLVELQIFVWIRSSLLYLPLSLLDLPCFFDFSPLGGVSCSVSDSDPDCDLLDLSVSDSDLLGLSFLDLLFLLPFFFPFLFGYGECFLLLDDCPLCRDDELFFFSFSSSAFASSSVTSFRRISVTMSWKLTMPA